MKKLIILSALILAGHMTFAQYALSKGQAQFNAGLGFSSWGIPVYAGIDAGVHKDISVGGELSYRSYHDRHNEHRYDHGILGLSGNGNYHFNSLLNIPKQWDFYAGLNVGLYFWNSDDDYPGNRNSGLALGAQIGGRYYFTERFGLNLEVGGANSLSGGKFGVTITL